MSRASNLFLTGLLVINTVCEYLAMASACFGLPMPPEFKSILELNSQTPERTFLISRAVGPGMFGLIATISLAALVFNDTKSKAAFASMVYYHMYISVLMIIELAQKRTNPLADPIGAIGFHLPFGLICMYALYTLVHPKSSSSSKVKHHNL